jgi:hypothetical protein
LIVHESHALFAETLYEIENHLKTVLIPA